MTRQENYNHAKFIIDRYDHYNDSVNNKSAFFIALNTFLLGGLFVGFVNFHRDMEMTRSLWYLPIVFGLSSILSTILIVIASNPFLVSGNKEARRRSLIFFGSVAEYKRENYLQAFTQQDDDRLTEDTVNQAWILATGLTSKYRKLRIAGWLLIFQFLLLIPIIYYIALNLINK
jgi:hypothetical protein